MALSDRTRYKGPNDLRKEQIEYFLNNQADYAAIERRIAIHTEAEIQKELKAKQAELNAAGGVSEFWGLFTLTGSRVAAKLIRTKYGECWAVCDKPVIVKQALTLGGSQLEVVCSDKIKQDYMYFVPFCKPTAELLGLASIKLGRGEKAKLRKELKEKVRLWEERRGFSQRRETVPARAVYYGHEQGTYGSMWVGLARLDNGYPENALYPSPTERRKYKDELDSDKLEYERN